MQGRQIFFWPPSSTGWLDHSMLLRKLSCHRAKLADTFDNLILIFQIYKLELEQKRLEEDAFVYNSLQQQLKLSPAYQKVFSLFEAFIRGLMNIFSLYLLQKFLELHWNITCSLLRACFSPVHEKFYVLWYANYWNLFMKMLELGACMEKEKASGLGENRDDDFSDISFEELLAQEKKDSFWLASFCSFSLAFFLGRFGLKSPITSFLGLHRQKNGKSRVCSSW